MNLAAPREPVSPTEEAAAAEGSHAGRVQAACPGLSEEPSKARLELELLPVHVSHIPSCQPLCRGLGLYPRPR